MVKDVVVTEQYVVRITAQRHINVAALIPGIIAKVLIKEGRLLFQFRPTIDQAKCTAAQADVEYAKIKLVNLNKLFEKRAVAAPEVKPATATLAKADAQLTTAKAELAFTDVKAPFEVLIGRLQHRLAVLSNQATQSRRSPMPETSGSTSPCLKPSSS